MDLISKEMKLFLMILALTAVGLGFSNDVMSNYFKDAYQATAFQRGIIEFPRELPGILCILLISLFSFLSDIRIAILSQVLSMIGMVVLGLTTPSYTVMLIFIFINSVGMHLFFILQDSIGLALITNKGETGKRMGQFRGILTAFQMAAAILVFFGFRMGFFSFETPYKIPFLQSGISFFIVLILIFFIPALGRWMDRFGIKTMLYADALSFIGVYLVYGCPCCRIL